MMFKDVSKLHRTLQPGHGFILFRTIKQNRSSFCNRKDWKWLLTICIIQNSMFIIACCRMIRYVSIHFFWGWGGYVRTYIFMLFGIFIWNLEIHWESWKKILFDVSEKLNIWVSDRQSKRFIYLNFSLCFISSVLP